MPGHKSEKIGFMVTPAMYDRWNEWAERKDMTLSAFVRYATEYYIRSCEKFEAMKQNRQYMANK